MARFYNQTAFMKSVRRLDDIARANASFGSYPVRAGVALARSCVEMREDDRTNSLCVTRQSTD